MQFYADATLSPLRRQHPQTPRQWGIVAHVLLVPALQICDPVMMFVLVKADDLSFHNTSPSLRDECNGILSQLSRPQGEARKLKKFG
jgi:hypothetical protein